MNSSGVKHQRWLGNDASSMYSPNLQAVAGLLARLQLKATEPNTAISLSDRGAFIDLQVQEPNRVGYDGPLGLRDFTSQTLTPDSGINYIVKGLQTRRKLRSTASATPRNRAVLFYRSEPEDAGVWNMLQRKLDRWAKLPDDWDGEDGIAPVEDVVAAAKSFLSRAKRANAPVPESYVAGDGEVGFRWRDHNAFASVAFLGDGHIVIFCRETDTTEPLKLDEPFSTDMDFSSLFARLARFG